MLRLLRRLEIWLLGDAPDPEWHAQTPVPRFTGYDEALQRRGVERARGSRKIRALVDTRPRHDHER